MTPLARCARPGKLLKKRLISWARAAIILAVVSPATTAGAATKPEAPLVLEATIPLPDVKGRIDHMAIDGGRHRLIVAELGNDTVEVIDLGAGKPLHRIPALAEPQGVGYSDKADLIFVANAGDGSVRIFRAADFALIGRIDLHSDADNIRIDPRSGNVIVGYGNGGLAIIDPTSRTQIGSIALPGHPEGFRIEPSTGRTFVNVPDAHQIAVVDLEQHRQQATWKIPGLGANFPMALDAAKGVLAAVFRSPSRLLLLDTKTGAVTARLPVCGDSDDVFFDSKRERIYVSCGAGEIAIFRREGTSYRPLASVATASGARTSLFVPELDRLFVAERAGLLGSNAAIRVYRPVP